MQFCATVWESTSAVRCPAFLALSRMDAVRAILPPWAMLWGRGPAVSAPEDHIRLCPTPICEAKSAVDNLGSASPQPPICGNVEPPRRTPRTRAAGFSAVQSPALPSGSAGLFRRSFQDGGPSGLGLERATYRSHRKACVVAATGSPEVTYGRSREDQDEAI